MRSVLRGACTVLMLLSPFVRFRGDLMTWKVLSFRRNLQQNTRLRRNSAFDQHQGKLHVVRFRSQLLSRYEQDI